MADVTLTDGSYRAIMVVDPRFTYDALDLSASTVTQDGSRAGIPLPAQPTRAILEATGEQENYVLTLTAKRGGFAKEQGGAAYTWESTGVTGEIGWETPTAMNELNPVVVASPTYPRLLANSPAILALPDGSIVAAYNSQSGATTDKTTTRVRFKSGVWQTPVDVGPLSSTTGGERNKMALLWDEDRQIVRLYILWRDVTISGQERARLSLYTSSDIGLSWTLTQEDCLTTPVDWSAATTGYTIEHISIAVAGDSLASLLISVTSNDTVGLDLVSTVIQYASGDGGFTFDLVEAYQPVSVNDPYGGVYYTVFPDQGSSLGFRVVWSSATSTNVGTIYIADLGNPYLPWSQVFSAPVVDLGVAISSISSKVLLPVAITIAQDSVGSTWIYYSSSTTLSQRLSILYVDRGGSGRKIGDTAAVSTPWVIGMRDPAEGLEEIAATFCAGGVVLLGRMLSASASAYTGALIAFTMGGFTGVTRRPVSFGSVLADYNSPYEVDWFGIAGFGSFSPWSVSTMGSPSTSLDTDLGFTVNCPGITDNYEATYTPTNSSSVQGHAQIIVQAVTGTTDFTLKSSDVINLRLRISSSSIVVRNMTAGIDMQTISLLTPGPHIIRASWHQGQSVTVYWRVEVTPWSNGASVRSWDSYSGTVSAAVSAGDRTRVEVSYPNQAVFYHVGFASGPNGTGLAEDILTPRPFSSSPSSVYHGVNVALVSGPVKGDDSWTITPRYDYGIRRVFQENDPSPRAKFKATASSTGSTTSLVFDLTDDGSAVRFGSPIMGLAFFNANFRTAEVYTGTSSSGPWTKVADVDMSCGLNNLAWERVGNTVSAPGVSPATGPFYVAENSLAGSTFVYKSGEVVNILRNTGGIWQNGSSVKRPRLILDGPSVDSSGTTGVIVHKDSLALIYGLLNVQYLRVLIPSQSTPSGVIELGNLMFGRVEILGKQYGRGRSTEFTPTIDTFTSSNGSRRTRVLAPMRKLITISWADNAIDTTSLWSDPASADYVRAAPGQPPAAYPAATSDQVEGLISQANGNPIVYISRLTSDTPDMVSPSSILRGRVLGPITRDVVMGDEEESEVVRIAGFTIEEEL